MKQRLNLHHFLVLPVVLFLLTSPCGIDGKTHFLSDYAAYPVLAVIFVCNHCPISQMYEQRIQSFYDEYTFKGVAVVVTQPNALRIDELDSSDISDPLDEMKVRAAWKHLTYPYLYDSAAEGK